MIAIHTDKAVNMNHGERVGRGGALSKEGREKMHIDRDRQMQKARDR